MINLQYLKSILPLYICETCGAGGYFNSECTTCQQAEIGFEYSRLEELALEDHLERDGMRYVDEFDFDEEEL